MRVSAEGKGTKNIMKFIVDKEKAGKKEEKLRIEWNYFNK